MQTSGGTFVPNLEMTKLMQGANFDRKTSGGMNSIRTTTNRNNIGIMLGTAASAAGQHTPSSNSLNHQQYTLTAKKGKQRTH